MGDRSDMTLKELQEELMRAEILGDLVEDNIDALLYCLNIVEQKKQLYDLQVASETSVQLDNLMKDAFIKEYSKGGVIRSILRKGENYNEE